MANINEVFARFEASKSLKWSPKKRVFSGEQFNFFMAKFIPLGSGFRLFSASSGEITISATSSHL